MVSGGDVQSIVVTVVWTLLLGFSFYMYRDHKLDYKAQISYELAFLEAHEDDIYQQQQNRDLVILLTFQSQEAEHLANLCQKYRKKWPLVHLSEKCFEASYEPGIQVHSLRFRRLDLIPFHNIKIQVIRCNLTHAIIETGDGHWGYLLERDTNNTTPTETVFNISKKFQYSENQPRATPAIELVEGLPT